MQVDRPSSRRTILGLGAGALGLLCGRPGWAQGGPAIAAIVNRDIVTTRDLSERIQLAIGSTGLPDTAETKRQLAPQVLRGLIDETLQLQEAKRLRIQVSAEEVQRAFTSIAERNRLTADALMAALRARGVDPGVLRRQLEAQIAWIKLVNRELRTKVAVTRDQIELALPRPGATDEVRLAEILLPVYGGEQEAQVLANARELAQTIARGADFAALARELSAGATAGQGGDLGWLALSSLVPDVREAVQGLAPGQVSAPVRSQSGVQLFRVVERRAGDGGARADEAEQRAEIQRRLEDEQLQRLAQRYLRNLRRDAFIDIRS